MGILNWVYKRIESITDKTEDTIEKITTKIDQKFIKYKREILLLIIQIFLISFGSILFILGIILFLSRYFPKDIILIIAGTLIINLSFLFNFIRK